MNPIDYVTEVNFYPGKSPVVARGKFVVAGQLAINFTIFEGKNGNRLSLPSTPNPKFDSTKDVSKDNKKFYDEVFPISADARQSLEAYIFGCYAKETGNDIQMGTNDLPF